MRGGCLGSAAAAAPGTTTSAAATPALARRRPRARRREVTGDTVPRLAPERQPSTSRAAGGQPPLTRSAASAAASVGFVPTAMPKRLERRLLARGGARGAGDDRTGVAHRLARRSGEPGDVGDDRLRHVLGDERAGLLLLVAADLADHDHELGLVVGLEALQDVDERRADDGVAADPDDRRAADAGVGQLVADLVGERAGARDQADVPVAEDVGRDDPDVGLARRERAGAVRAEQRHASRPNVRVHVEHLVRRDALGDADDGLDAGVDGLVDRVGGEARRDEDHRGVRAVLVDRRGDGVHHGDAVDVLPALARGDAGDDLRAVVAVARGVEPALAAR